MLGVLSLDRGDPATTLGVSDVVDQYRSTVKPMYERFVEPTKRNADLVVPEGANEAAVGLLEEVIRAAVAGDATRSRERSPADVEDGARDER